MKEYNPQTRRMSNKENPLNRKKLTTWELDQIMLGDINDNQL